MRNDESWVKTILLDPGLLGHHWSALLLADVVGDAPQLMIPTVPNWPDIRTSPLILEDCPPGVGIILVSSYLIDVSTEGRHAVVVPFLSYF